MQDMIIAGSDTTSASADWMMLELLLQPQLVGKLRKELDEVAGRAQFVYESDIPRLSYLQAVFMESLRLHPPAPHGVPFCSTRKCVVAGYNIPAGTTALLNVQAITRNAIKWADPLSFDPERFVELNKRVSGEAHGLLPYLSDQTDFFGMLLGPTLVKLTVANLMHSFDFQALGIRNEDIDMKKEAPGLVSSRAVNLWVHPKPRK